MSAPRPLRPTSSPGSAAPPEAMTTVAEPAGRGSLVAPVVVIGALATLAATVVIGPSSLHTSPRSSPWSWCSRCSTALCSSWTSLLAALLTVVLFIPMQRFVLPGSLPFELEPYRVLVAFIFTGWVASLFVDSRVSLRRTGFEGPLLLLAAGVFGSVVVNATRVRGLETDVAKALTFFVSFLLVFYVVVSVVRTRAHVDLLLKVIVACGAVVAAEAVVESRTEFNLFNDLPRLIPLLKLGSFAVPPSEDRGFRAYASAQHPIALGALLIVLLPLAHLSDQAHRPTPVVDRGGSTHHGRPGDAFPNERPDAAGRRRRFLHPATARRRSASSPICSPLSSPSTSLSRERSEHSSTRSSRKVGSSRSRPPTPAAAARDGLRTSGRPSTSSGRRRSSARATPHGESSSDDRTPRSSTTSGSATCSRRDWSERSAGRGSSACDPAIRWARQTRSLE